MRIHRLILGAAAVALVACGKDSSGPTISPAAAKAIARFDYLADSATNAGNPDDAQLFTGAAEAVRVTGDVGTLPVSIDGTSSDFFALSLQLTMPASSACDEFGCYDTPASEEQFLVAWQEEPAGRVMFISKDGFGAKNVAFDTTSVDTLTAPPPGVALVADESGAGWFSTAGTASNQAVGTGGACARLREPTPGVAYSCSHATYRWSADFTAGEAAGAAIGTEHHIVIPATVVAGAKLAITGFTGEVAAKLGKAPIRSRLVLKRDRAIARAGR
jgi:hypothetical protein